MQIDKADDSQRPCFRSDGRCFFPHRKGIRVRWRLTLRCSRSTQVEVEMSTTKRMQRIYCVGFSSDAKFILSGSDDTNVRMLKADAPDNLGVLPGRQAWHARHDRVTHMPEIRRITTDKKVPKAIKKGPQCLPEHLSSVQTGKSYRPQ